jgi:hypothetical protein
MAIDFFTTSMEDSSTPLLDVWSSPAVTNWAGLAGITIVDFVNADAQYSAKGPRVQQPVVGFNCSAANCVIDGLTMTAAIVGDPTKHPAVINYNPAGGRVASATLLNDHNGGGVDITTADGVPTGSWSSKNDGGGFTFVSDTVSCPTRKESQHAVEGCSSKLTGLSTHAIIMGMSGEATARLAIDGDGSMKFGNGGAGDAFDTTLHRPITGSKAWDPPPLSGGAANVTSIVVGACSGNDGSPAPHFDYGCPSGSDVVSVTHSELGMNAVQLTAHVADKGGTIAVVLRNAGMETVDIPSGLLHVVIWKFAISPMKHDDDVPFSKTPPSGAMKQFGYYFVNDVSELDEVSKFSTTIFVGNGGNVLGPTSWDGGAHRIL